jgi:hypothetical protein
MSTNELMLGFYMLSRLNKVNGVITSTPKTLKGAKAKTTELGYEFEVGKHLWGTDEKYKL